MAELPEITTDRLRLRRFVAGDAPEVQRLAGDADVAATTLRIPHPYPDGAAEQWIRTHAVRTERGSGADWAVTIRQSGSLIGAIGLEIERDHAHAELGYWIGKPYWGNGYATEAASAVIDHAFGAMKLHRVFAHYMAHNPASGRVLEKAGLTREGLLAEHIRKNGRFTDIVLYGITRDRYHAGRPVRA